MYNEEFTEKFNEAIETIKNDPNALAVFNIHAMQVFEQFARNNGKTLEQAMPLFIKAYRTTQ